MQERRTGDKCSDIYSFSQHFSLDLETLVRIVEENNFTEIYPVDRLQERYSYMIEQSVPNDSYQYTGETNMTIEDRSFILEDTPESVQEETVVLDFYYTITAEYAKKYDIQANIESHRISIENERKSFEEGRNTTAYTIHQIETLTEDQYTQQYNADGDSNPLYYAWLEKRLDEYGLGDYAIINVTFTQTLSDAKINAGPQYGNGTYERNYLVGKTKDDDSYEIYDFGWM